MSDHEFENYLTLISRFLRLSPAQREAIGEELRDHFESRLAELVERGVPHDEAVRIAIEEFGDAAGLAANFTSISQIRRRSLIMRCTVASVATIAAAVIVAMAVWPENNAGRVVGNAVGQTKDTHGKPEPERPLTIEELNARTQQMLNGLMSAEFVETPLQEALTYLSDKHKFDIYINKRSLSDAAIDPVVAPVTLNLHNVRLKTFLGWMLEQHNLGYAVRDGVLVIGTKDWLDSQLETRVYDCRALLASQTTASLDVKSINLKDGFDSNVESTPSAIRNTTVRRSYLHMAQLGAGVNRPDIAAQFVTPAGQLVQLIRSTVEAPSWETQGGAGTIVEYQGLLVVSQTAETHTQVAELLEQLNAKLAVQPKAIQPK